MRFVSSWIENPGVAGVILEAILLTVAGIAVLLAFMLLRRGWRSRLFRQRDSRVLEIRSMTAGDWSAVAAIYAEGIATRTATFETEPRDYAAFDTSHHPEHRLVAVEDNRILGWAALAPTSSRACYAGVAESSVYVSADARGRGVGRALMEAVVASAAAGGIWTIHAGMFPENAASIGLHESLGFRAVGRFERIAQLDGAWRDTVLLELRL